MDKVEKETEKHTDKEGEVALEKEEEKDKEKEKEEKEKESGPEEGNKEEKEEKTAEEEAKAPRVPRRPKNMQIKVTLLDDTLYECELEVRVFCYIISIFAFYTASRCTDLLELGFFVCTHIVFGLNSPNGALDSISLCPNITDM